MGNKAHPTTAASLVSKFGPGKSRITSTGEVHAYGTMPNTNRRGWYLLGYVGDAQMYASLGL